MIQQTAPSCPDSPSLSLHKAARGTIEKDIIRRHQDGVLIKLVTRKTGLSGRNRINNNGFQAAFGWNSEMYVVLTNSLPSTPTHSQPTLIANLTFLIRKKWCTVGGVHPCSACKAKGPGPKVQSNNQLASAQRIHKNL